MLYSGDALFEHLTAASMQEDTASSSHWRELHRNFLFQGGNFSGLQGFGGCHAPYRGLRLLTHKILQFPYRRLGRQFPDFSSLDMTAEKIAARQGRAYELDFIRQSLTLALLRHKLSWIQDDKYAYCVIGDGFASMATLLVASAMAGKVILVNLTKTLLVDCWYLRLWLGQEKFSKEVVLVDDEHSLSRAENFPIIAIEAKNHQLLKKTDFDIVLNIVSMGEMDPPVVAEYFKDIREVSCRRPVHFYCCNRIEKLLPDSTIVRFADYPWSNDDEILLDELCPWHQKFYSREFPFYHAYDGPIKHRVARMSCGG